MRPRDTDQLTAKIRLQQYAMLWERIWRALNWPLIVCGLAVVAASSGLFNLFNSSQRIASLIALGLMLVASLRDLVRVKMPTDVDAMRRIEFAAGLPHRRVSSKNEALVPELGDAETQALWQEHKRRQLSGLTNVPISPPRSAWRLFDPVALRVPVALLAVVSLVLGQGSLRTSFSAPEIAVAPEVAPQIAVDAWLKPPSYTGKPPLLLTSPAMRDKLASGGDILVPENSQLTVRVVGAADAKVTFHGLGGAQAEVKDITAKTGKTESAFTADAKITRPVTIRVSDGTRELASFPVATVPDAPPTITIPNAPKIETGGSVTVTWEAKDDYGVRSIVSEVALADEQEDGVGFAGNGPFLFEPPEFPVALKKPNAKQENGKTSKDLTAHPWAGLTVTLTLTARDGGGNSALSEPLTFKLPERIFTKPLAKALMEQRKRLIIEPDLASDVATLFDTILIYPKGLLDRSAHHIRLAAIASQLEQAADTDEVKTAIGDIWQLALDIEDGSLADAKAELRSLKEQLEQALKNGASDEEIAKLMDKMREAMNRYLDAMRQEMQRQNRQADQNPLNRDQQQQSRELSRQDLQRMLDQIEKMSKDGNRDMAQSMLEELDRMLQNLQPGQNRQAGQQGGDPLGEMLDELSDIMRQQQRLMDQTQRAPGEQSGDQPGEEPGQHGEGQQPGEGQGQMGQNGKGMGGLADQQGALRDLLDRLEKQLQGNAPGSLGEAGREMDGAQGSLRDSDREGALQQQGNALDQLRKGAQELSRLRRQQGQGQANNDGRDGPGGRNDDPLGRPRASRNADQGPDKDMVPAERAAQRARQILEKLREKANEQGLTEGERAYIDRLLRGLY